MKIDLDPRPPRALAVLMGAVVLGTLALGLAGCEAAFNTAYGNGYVRPPTLYKRTTTTKRTEASPSTPATDESTCTGGACMAPDPK